LHQPDPHRRLRGDIAGVARHRRLEGAGTTVRPRHAVHPRRLLSIDGVESVIGDAPVLREFAVRTAVDGATVVERMAEEGFLAGIPLQDEYGGGLLVTVTERRTKTEIDAFVSAFEKVVK